MAQLKSTLIQGSARITDTLYANNINGGTITAPIYWENSTTLPEKASADYFLAIDAFASGGKTYFVKAANVLSSIGVGASGTHADSYFVKAITSVDNKIVRFDGNAGQIQTGPITISDEGYIRSYNSTRWTLDWYIFHPGASKQVAELYFDSGDATNITRGTLYWRQYSPTSTNSNTPTSFHETYNLPTVTKGLTESKSYSIITTKNLSSITAVGTITSGTWNGSAVPVANGGTGATTAANARTNLGLGSAAIYNITGGNEGYSSSATLIPRIGTDGVMEVGKYIDFHASTGTSKDYDVRITAATTGLTISGTTSGTFSGSLSGNATNVTGTVAVAHGGTGVTSFTNDCVIVSTGTTQTLVSRGLKVTGATNADVTIQNNTSAKALNINSPGGAAAITINTAANSSTGVLTLNSGNTLYINKPTNASIIFTNGGADTSHEKGRFNTQGMLQLNSTVSQNTHKLLVNGDSAFTGKVAFTNAANTITTYAYIEYDDSLHTLNFSVT